MDIGDLVTVGGSKDKPLEASYLGEFDDRSWFMDFSNNRIYWKVPEFRETISAPIGYQIVAADFSQIEVKIMAFLSQDPILIEAINSGLDTHCYIAFRVFGKKRNFTYEEIYEATQGANAKAHPRNKELKELRTRIKITVFGSAYGAGPETIAFQTGMNVDEAKEFLIAFFEEFHVLKSWLDKQGNLALSHGYTQTPKGRKRFYVLPQKSDPEYDRIISQIRRWAGNHPVQAASADMLKIALRKFYLALRGGNPVGEKIYDASVILVVHDEIVVECRTEHVTQVSALLKKCMEEAYYEIIQGIKNKIDVVVDSAWEKV